MIRLVLVWVVIAALIFGVRYFMDQLQRKEASRWGLRMAWCGTISAIMLAVVIVLERL